MSRKIKNWLDQFDKIMYLQAESAGLLEHKVTIGQIREFIIQDVLSKFLPSSVTVGSGKILSSKEDKYSNQIDIIIFDNRFPRFSITGSNHNAIYPIEGVIATMEIKTKLTTKTLKSALDNCFSVIKLPIQIKNLNKHIEEYKTQHQCDDREAAQNLMIELAPHTYIFSFKKSILKDSFLKTIKEWIETYRALDSGVALLPRLIITQGLIGITKGDIIEMKNGFFSVCEVEDIKFGLFASHLLNLIHKRLNPGLETKKIYYSIDGLTPLKLYIESIKNENCETLMGE